MEIPLIEQENVHKVYSKIAEHFSQTRYKPWPVVERFLSNQRDNSLGCDVGCGNGKNLKINQNLFILGTDFCENLVKFATLNDSETLVSDNISLPFKDNLFDFCISIAVIHHFSTEERRLKAVQEITKILKPKGSCLIFVWAKEQFGRRDFSSQEQDVMVPWKKDQETFNRFYHLFNKGELEDLVIKAGNLEIQESGYDRDNWFVIVNKI